VLVWPTFPQVGIDDRNQFDWIRSMPGGVVGLKGMVAAFHAEGVKVLLPYNPWVSALSTQAMCRWLWFIDLLRLRECATA
jgi:hypothetical protein